MYSTNVSTYIKRNNFPLGTFEVPKSLWAFILGHDDQTIIDHEHELCENVVSYITIRRLNNRFNKRKKRKRTTKINENGYIQQKIAPQQEQNHQQQ